MMLVDWIFGGWNTLSGRLSKSFLGRKRHGSRPVNDLLVFLGGVGLQAEFAVGHPVVAAVDQDHVLAGAGAGGDIAGAASFAIVVTARDVLSSGCGGILRGCRGATSGGGFGFGGGFVRGSIAVGGPGSVVVVAASGAAVVVGLIAVFGNAGSSIAVVQVSIRQVDLPFLGDLVDLLLVPGVRDDGSGGEVGIPQEEPLSE